MKQSSAVKAYFSAKKLNSQDATPVTAKHIFMLMRALQPAYDFQIQEEQKIFEKHPAVDMKTMSISTKTDEEKEIALKEIEALNNEFKALAEMETEVKFDKVVIDTAQEAGLKLSGEDIENLESFIEFV